jgi:hypothetical protein
VDDAPRPGWDRPSALSRAVPPVAFAD